MLVKAEQKFARVSAQKVRLLVNEIKTLIPEEALIKLGFINRAGAKELLKVIKQAINNAVNVKKLNGKNLKFKEILIGEAPVFKRWRPKARGRISPIHKRNCHIKVILEG